MRHGAGQDGLGRCGGDVLQGVDGGQRRLVRGRPGVQPLDQLLNPLLILGSGPSQQLPRLDARRKLGSGKRGRQQPQRIGQCRRGGGSLQSVDRDRRPAAGTGFDVDLFQHRLDSFLIRRRGPHGQPLRIVGRGRQSSSGQGRGQYLRGVGSRDVLQRVDGDLPCDLRRRRLSQFVDQRPDLLVVFGRGPDDHLPFLGTRRETGLGNHSGQERAGVVDGAGAHAFHFVDRYRVGTLRVARDVDLFDDGLDRRLVGRAGPGGQSLRIAHVGTQLGPRHSAGHDRLGRGGCNVLQAVDGSHGRFVRRRPGVQAIDQFLDALMVLGAGPGQQLPRFGPRREFGFGIRGRQQLRRVRHVRRQGRALQPVNGHRGPVRRTGFDIHLGQDRLDRVVVRGTGPGGQTLRLACVDRQFRLRHRRLQQRPHAVGIGELQRVHGHLGSVGGVAGAGQLVDQLLDLLVFGRGGPGDHLLRSGAQRETGSRKSVGQKAAHVQAAGRGHARQRVDDGLGSQLGHLRHVDVLQNGLDGSMIRRPRPGGEALRIGRIGGQFRSRRHLPQDGQRGGRRNGCGGIDGDFRCRFDGRLLRQLVHQDLQTLVVPGSRPSQQLIGLGGPRDPGRRHRGGQKLLCIDQGRGVHVFERIDDGGRIRPGSFFDIDLRQCVFDRLMLGRLAPHGQPLRVEGIRRELGGGYDLP